ncbi:S66 peptidase family protein [Actinoplanes sichuanensis]|uniref:LD-carboxypeptidase n=1 Tax=Actinoplanes sichuanensis TaxID=512349 RepID=A0ABW4ASA8_9ACTN|nr:LD-carboxypeptidase [Actinoplanes sichuanensis]
MIRPRRLEPGDLVALVAPAGPVTEAQAADAAGILKSWGLRTQRGPHALGRRSFLSGTDDERRSDLEAAFRDPEVRGILCLRGGYGTQRIVDHLDYAAIRADPKLVVGFSDITALHLALWHEAGLATVHGPTGSTLLNDPPTTAAARQSLTTTTPLTITAEPGPDPAPPVVVHHPGQAHGTLLGGNLTLLAATAGTRHQPDLTGAILLLEEVNEAAYRVDRMIVQLERSGWFEGLAGVAVGSFTACPGADEVLAEHLNDRGIPVLAGLPIGHGRTQLAVPLGVPAALNADTGTLTVEPAVH